ncbi:ATP-binding protein [Sphaerisporangium sp. NPDC088356]|uniref:ATP-binding protein n=1 Tax=Sphaerisporangium sp. NPDC088356 TaxID=3154871 RepID=UPI003413069E
MAAWRMSRSFLGSPLSVTEARRFVTTFLMGWPVVEAAELIVSELATNAIRHSATNRFGGRFHVMIHAQHDRVWLGVTDEGGPRSPRMLLPDEQQESGRGLLLVGALADSYGVRGDDNGRTVWAMLLVEAVATTPATSWQGSGASSA